MSFASSAGGTLALPSPTHAHHMDMTSAVHGLRSISRSPSKFLSRTSSQSSDASQQASPQSPCRRFGITPSHPPLSPLSYPQTAPPAVASKSTTAGNASSSFTAPVRLSGRLSLRSAKAAKTHHSSRPLARARASPRSPLKRALSDVPDSGNSSRSSSSSPPSTSSSGQENRHGYSLGSTPRKHADKLSRHSVHLDVTGAALQYSFLKVLDANESFMVSTTGALKRSDATMNLDHPSQGSPVAKRRSLHGISSFGQTDGLNIFGTNHGVSQSFDIHEDSQSEYELTGASDTSSDDPSDVLPLRDLSTSPSPTSNMMTRASSLRRSTLQQRHGDKGSLGRRTGERHLAQLTTETSTPARNRPRLSTDQFLAPQVPRDSPPASAQPADGKIHQPHPLSKTLTTSTSGNSLNEESSACVPAAKVVGKPKLHAFSRSLPLNATRPTAHSLGERMKTIATPSQSHQLWVDAFNSTGLISKVNRNPEDEAEKKIAPPDTPCKKHTNPFATFPPLAGSAMKRKNNRNSYSGVPSTPFNPPFSRGAETFGVPGKGLSIFQRGSAALSARRGGSLAGLELDDRMLFGENGELSGILDGDVPPTPTKNMLKSSLSNVSEQSLESPSANRSFSLPLSAVKAVPSRESTCKSNLHRLEEHGGEEDDGRGSSIGLPAGAAIGGQAFLTPGLAPRSSLSRWRGQPVAIVQSSPLTSPWTKKAFTKIRCVDIASPVDGQRTPHTPQESLLPLDTSRLSISQAAPGLSENSMPPPVTPTADRDFRSSTTSIFVTPVNVRVSDLDIDASLYSRFDKVEQVGGGVFSTVYRVTKDEQASPMAEESAHGPVKGQVFAVKRIKRACHGPKQRDARLREVRILQALTHSEHVVRYVDNWEHNFHLYIQTEFCEEGTLNRFLNNIGREGRLDDFRIFKILQDLCLGLKDIHDAGFMHLDMKPANIFINFEGGLKIGDFGLAQSCSSAEGFDDEGDREYMAPELLKGKAGQEADIFSLGLMMLEAAANVSLPDNGPIWRALRSGDLSEVPTLMSTLSSEIQRDGTGTRSSQSIDMESSKAADSSDDHFFGCLMRSELQQAPDFMVNAFHPSSIDSIVRWMTAEDPGQRPLVDEVLELEGLVWMADHRKAPATVYEGNWGPAEPIPVSIGPDSDTEMMDT